MHKNWPQEHNGKCLSIEYVNSREKLKWQCEHGHIFEATYNKVQQGRWCRECAIKRVANFHKGNFTYDIDDMKKLAQQKDGECLSGRYLGWGIKLKWQCHKGHVWENSPGHIINGQWCPYCSNNTSDSEQAFRKVIENVLGVSFPKKRPKWLLNDSGNRLELDGYNEELGIAFEYQGRQHFEIVTAFKGTNAILRKAQKHDKIKKSLCKKHGVALLCPDYKLKEDEFEDYILENLKE